MANAGIGIYRKRGTRGRPDTAYVTDGSTAVDIPEARYRLQGFRPEFDRLSWLEDLPDDDVPSDRPFSHIRKVRMRHIYGLAGFIAAFFFLAVTVVFAQDVTHPAPGAPLRAEILDSARPIFVGETNGPIEFVVRQLNVWNDWAFGDVRLQRPGGQPIDWRKTQFADDVRNGMFDPAGSFFLLKRIDSTWALVEHATGPTDVAWDGWRADHGLPLVLFERPNAQ